MKKLLLSPYFWLCAVLLAFMVACSIQHMTISHMKEETARLEDNQGALFSQVEFYKTENGELAASVQALTLREDELNAMLPKYRNEIKQLRTELKNVKNISQVDMETSVDVITPLEPIIKEESISKDKYEENLMERTFSWKDDWVSVNGKIYEDSVSCSFISRDSLLLVAHYEKRKCIFASKKKGRLIKYDVRSKNPHSIINNIEYIEIIN